MRKHGPATTAPSVSSHRPRSTYTDRIYLALLGPNLRALRAATRRQRRHEPPRGARSPRDLRPTNPRLVLPGVRGHRSQPDFDDTPSSRWSLDLHRPTVPPAGAR